MSVISNSVVGKSLFKQQLVPSKGVDTDFASGGVSLISIRYTDLHAFKRDCLLAIVGLKTIGGPPSGQDVLDVLEDWYGEELNQSRIYQNLQQLVHQQLLNVETEGRENRYEPTHVSLVILRERYQKFHEYLANTNHDT